MPSPDGRLVYVAFKQRQLLQMLSSAFAAGPGVVCMVLNERQENLDLARTLIESGQLRAHVDRVYPLAEAAEAHRYAESCARKGPVVLSVPLPGCNILIA